MNRDTRHLVAYRREAAPKFQTERRPLQHRPRLVGMSEHTLSSDLRHLLLGREENPHELCAQCRRTPLVRNQYR